MPSIKPIIFILVCGFIAWVSVNVSLYIMKIKIVTWSHSDLRDNTCHNNTAQSPIPKLIHQTWKNDVVPENWRSAVATCKNKNPKYKYRLWTDEQLEKFLAAEYPWFLATYHSYPYNIQRVDAARLFILYHYGGVYMDLDIVCLGSWDEIIRHHPQSGAFLLETGPFGVTNDIMAAKPKDPFLKFLIEGLLDSDKTRYVLKYPTVIFSTGPMMISDRLMKYHVTGCLTVINVEEKDRLFGNLPGSSWHSWEGIVIYGFYNYYIIIISIILVIVIIYCLKKWLTKDMRREHQNGRWVDSLKGHY